MRLCPWRPGHNHAVSSLQDRVVLVTGGSTGIGRAVVHRLAADRARVVAVARDQGRLSEALAIAAGAETTLNPPPVTPVVAVVGAVVIGSDRPRGVLVSRVGHLPRLLQAFGDRLVPQAVEQTFAVARRSVTWTR